MKMIFLAFVALCLTSATFAQRHVEYGLKGGVNLANLKDDANANTDARTGWHIGGLAHIHLTRQFALQPELVYSSQGAEYPGNGYKLKLNYLNIPILGQYMFGQGFRFQTGPQFGILTSSESKSGDTETDIDDGLNTFDFSWSFGTGYLSSTGLGVDLRYNHGVSNIAETSPDLKNRVWQIGVFYQFKH